LPFVVVAMLDWTSGTSAAPPIARALIIRRTGMLGERRTSGRKCLAVR
jgi:hypothetical protein